MSIPRHFSQRPRRKMAPPPNDMQAHHTPTVEVVPAVEAAPAPVVETPAPESPVVEAAPAAPAPEVAAEPKWNATMKKADLLKIAQDLGLDVTEADTKAAILTALDGTLAGQ